MQVKMKPTKGDLFLGIAIVALGILLFLAVFFTKKGGDRVVVELDGQVYGRYSLDEDQTVEIDGHNRLVIENGKAWMGSADCPDGDCLRQGALDEKGGSIVCLPNRVVVTVAGDADVDAVAGGA